MISRDVGQMGFLERENAAILNASILKFARRTIRGFKKAMVSIGLGSCPLFLNAKRRDGHRCGLCREVSGKDVQQWTDEFDDRRSVSRRSAPSRWREYQKRDQCRQ